MITLDIHVSVEYIQRRLHYFAFSKVSYQVANFFYSLWLQDPSSKVEAYICTCSVHVKIIIKSKNKDFLHVGSGQETLMNTNTCMTGQRLVHSHLVSVSNYNEKKIDLLGTHIYIKWLFILTNDSRKTRLKYRNNNFLNLPPKFIIKWKCPAHSPSITNQPPPPTQLTP